MSSGCHRVLTDFWFHFVPDLGSEDGGTTQCFSGNKVEVPCRGDGVTMLVAATRMSLLLVTQH